MRSFPLVKLSTLKRRPWQCGHFASLSAPQVSLGCGFHVVFPHGQMCHSYSPQSSHLRTPAQAEPSGQRQAARYISYSLQNLQ